jgi:hypothetical protein
VVVVVVPSEDRATIEGATIAGRALSHLLLALFALLLFAHAARRHGGSAALQLQPALYHVPIAFAHRANLGARTTKVACALRSWGESALFLAALSSGASASKLMNTMKPAC